ncbi:MAG: hypothetical protein ACC661_12770, partial [Verrucomicrobiales bacterium]
MIEEDSAEMADALADARRSILAKLVERVGRQQEQEQEQESRRGEPAPGDSSRTTKGPAVPRSPFDVEFDKGHLSVAPAVPEEVDREAAAAETLGQTDVAAGSISSPPESKSSLAQKTESDTLVAPCPNCDHLLNVNRAMVGVSGRCPNCRTPIVAEESEGEIRVSVDSDLGLAPPWDPKAGGGGGAWVPGRPAERVENATAEKPDDGAFVLGVPSGKSAGSLEGFAAAGSIFSREQSAGAESTADSVDKALVPLAGSLLEDAEKKRFFTLNKLLVMVALLSCGAVAFLAFQSASPIPEFFRANTATGLSDGGEASESAGAGGDEAVPLMEPGAAEPGAAKPAEDLVAKGDSIAVAETSDAPARSADVPGQKVSEDAPPPPPGKGVPPPGGELMPKELPTPESGASALLADAPGAMPEAARADGPGGATAAAQVP